MATFLSSFSRRLIPRARPAAASFSPTCVLFRPTSRLFATLTDGDAPLSGDISKLRNVAIIAHVDHGKTTLVDQLLRQGGTKLDESKEQLASNPGRLMDSGDIETERGITILSKCTRIRYKDYTLNIVDTPGHADFGGEVERVLSMVDGVVLVVDHCEGPKTQTKFVLKKALANPRIKPIVVLNKVDRPSERHVSEVENEIFDLFANLGASDEVMDYPTLYASGKAGWCSSTWDGTKDAKDMMPLFDALIEHIPEPHKIVHDAEITEGDKSKGFSMLVSQFDRVKGLGDTATGKIYSGIVKPGMKIMTKNIEGATTNVNGQITDVSVVVGTKRESVPKAYAGDVVSITTKNILPRWTDTVMVNEKVPSVECTPIDPPTMGVRVSVNTSPFSGKEGGLTNNMQISERLKNEALTNVAIEVHDSPRRDYFEIRGRGEMQLGVLLENMRREGFELTLTAPVVVMTEENGIKMEPWEEVTVELPKEFSAGYIDRMGTRDAEIKDMTTSGDVCVVKCDVSSRNFMGMRTWLREHTGGQAFVGSQFIGRKPAIPPADKQRKGMMISGVKGKTCAMDLGKYAQKGTLFVGPNTELYPGMIIGEFTDQDDTEINVCHVYSTNYDSAKPIKTVRKFYIEQALSYIADDECIELTPKRITLRKKLLSAQAREHEKKNIAKGKA